jgi:DNA-binding transcriptional LysR family regulator
MSGADDLDWDELRYFLRAIEAKTLAGAARALDVEATTVGRRLTSLERSLGAPLVVRGPDGLSLTPLGKKLAPLVSEVERAVVAVTESVTDQKARVRVAMPSGIARFFTRNIARLRDTHPEVSLEMMSGARHADLMKGEADLALRVGPPGHDELVARKLCDMGWSLYASASYLERKPAPIDPDDLTGHEIVAYDAKVASFLAAQWIEERARKATIVVRNRELTEMVDSILGGVGLGLIPCWFEAFEPSLKRLSPAVLVSRSFSVVYRREVLLVPHMRAVIDFLISVVQENAVTIEGDASGGRAV